MKYITQENVHRGLPRPLRWPSLVLAFAFVAIGANAQHTPCLGIPCLIPPGEQIGAVTPATNKLDIFPSDNAGYIWQGKWEPDFTNWQGWHDINGFLSEGYTGSPVTAVSRSQDKIDLFTVGPDHRVWTAAWDSVNRWHVEGPIGNLQLPFGSYVTAVSRSTDKLDIFAVGTDGQVWTVAWEPGFTGWHGWWPIPFVHAQPGTTVAAVSPSTDVLDIFVVDVNGFIEAAAWQPAFTGWTSWRVITGVQTVPGATVTAVSRSQDKLDVFVVASYQVYTAAWEPDFLDWTIWRPINGLQTMSGSAVTAVSRSQDKLDVYVAAFDETVWTAAWEPDFKDGWHVFQIPLPIDN